MGYSKDNLSIEDVIDKGLLKYILGLLSSYVGCASFTMSKTHEEVDAVKSTNFCDNVFRKTESGAKACKECDEKHCKLAAQTGEVQLYKCHAGINTSAIPVFDGKNYLGAIMCGQVLFEEPDLELCKQKAREFGIDEQTYIDAYKQIPVVDEAKFKEALKQVNSFCNAISNLAKAKRIELYQQHKDDFVLSLLNSINSKQDIKKSLNKMVSEIAELFDVDRVVVLDLSDNSFDVDADYFAPNKLSEEDIDKIHKEEHQEWVWVACKKLIEDNSNLMIVRNLDDFDMPQNMKELYKELGLKSGMSSISEGKTKAIILENFREYRNWTNRDKAFLDVIVKEISLALTQAEMTKEMEHQLNVQETLMNNIPFVIAMKNLQGQYLAINDLFLKYYNLKKENVIGNISENILSKDMYEKSKKIEDYVLETKEPLQEDFQKIEGNITTWKRMCVSPILDKQKEMIGYAGYTRDITDQIEIEQLKSEFISTVSHELRTPLTSIIGGLGLALSGALGEMPPKIKTVLEISQHNSNRLHTLIKDILDIDKLSAGEMIYNYEIIDVSKIVFDAIKDLEEFGKKYKIQVNYNPPLYDTLFLNVDKSRFIQIFTNILSNAIKYSDKNKEVDVYVDDLPNDKIRVSVLNYGPEVPKDLRSKIYDRFAQGDSAIMRKKDSTGLGLSITHQLVNDMNGIINYDSKNGKTVFYVEFDKVENPQK